MQQMIFIADLIACSTCYGHNYAHHQELESIIQMVAACGIWCFGFQFVGMVWSWRLCVRFATGSNHLYNTLELLMMDIIVPETCWASNKICNKKHLLHLVGILFPLFWEFYFLFRFNHAVSSNNCIMSETDKWISNGHWSSDTDSGKAKYLGKWLSQCNFVHHKFCMDWSGNKWRPS